MAAQIINRARFEVAYWALCVPGFTLANAGYYRAGIAWLRTVRPIANALSPNCL